MGLYDRLLNTSTTSVFGLKGNKGPKFEDISDRTTSDIQGLVQGQALLSSQDMINGRIYAPYKPAFAPPSQLDLNGKAPDDPTKQVPYTKYGPKF